MVPSFSIFRYDTPADMWSLGCMTFELLTGDLLFDPQAGEDYDRDEDHLALFQELLGKMPKHLAVAGKYSKQFFDKKGTLKHIKTLKCWPVQDVLMEQYHYSKEDAQDVADFLTPLLDFDPKTRATALDSLRNKWLQE
jgi:serine/threonine-protein kinase SRPK3